MTPLPTFSPLVPTDATKDDKSKILSSGSLLSPPPSMLPPLPHVSYAPAPTANSSTSSSLLSLASPEACNFHSALPIPLLLLPITVLTPATEALKPDMITQVHASHSISAIITSAAALPIHSQIDPILLAGNAVEGPTLQTQLPVFELEPPKSPKSAQPVPPINPFTINLLTLSTVLSMSGPSSLPATSMSMSTLDIKPNTAKATNDLCHIINKKSNSLKNLFAIDYMCKYPKASRGIVMQAFAALNEEKTKFYSFLSIDNKAKKTLLKIAGTAMLD
ncbi:hypothetical protein K439DRAFT_1619064 [Ramaria rubella]|nr:hypothetical protein K439DRAFT_1619064 [Ramaria rubella]